MRVDVYPQIAVIRAATAEDFEERFNAKAHELADKITNTKVEIDGTVFTAIISYKETVEVMDSVADEFHADGIRYLCKHCPHIEDPLDKRVKWCECKYSELGRTHKEHEACEFFYRQLKAGRVQPKGEME